MRGNQIIIAELGLVLEQTWVQVWSLAFLGRSSSFSSGLGLGNKVRNVQSSMSKFGELFKPFWGTFLGTNIT